MSRLNVHNMVLPLSCLDLLEYLNALTKLVDGGYKVNALYLDFAKVSDKVLILKLEENGITGNVRVG